MTFLTDAMEAVKPTMDGLPTSMATPEVLLDRTVVQMKAMIGSIAGLLEFSGQERCVCQYRRTGVKKTEAVAPEQPG